MVGVAPRDSIQGSGNRGPRNNAGPPARLLRVRDAWLFPALPWQEKRRETEPQDFSDNLAVQVTVGAETLNRSWYNATLCETLCDP
jgi:hypothetical protein